MLRVDGPTTGEWIPRPVSTPSTGLRRRPDPVTTFSDGPNSQDHGGRYPVTGPRPGSIPGSTYVHLRDLMDWGGVVGPGNLLDPSLGVHEAQTHSSRPSTSLHLHCPSGSRLFLIFPLSSPSPSRARLSSHSSLTP